MTRVAAADPGLRVAHEGKHQVRFGVIADVHQNVMHDAQRRLATFVEAMERENPDFVIQLGDFCSPSPENRPFLEIWNRLKCPRYHVLGNHDMDALERSYPVEAYAFARQQTMEFWGMQARYFSWDVKGLHFVVLDGNDEGGTAGGYRRFIADDQAKWLKKDLANTELPCILFSHQSLEHPSGVENQQAIRAILEQANQDAGFRKVLSCFSGHHHRDYVRWIHGILYPQINSASYYWLGEGYGHLSLGPEIHQSYPLLDYTAPYQKPLFCLVTVDQQYRFLQIEGRETQFVGKTPWELGMSREEHDEASLRPMISDWKIPID